MGPRECLRIKLYGVGPPGLPELVDARVFSEKLRVLLSALAAADKARNGRTSFDYFVADLKKSSVDATILSVTRPHRRKQPNESAVGAFSKCLAAVALGKTEIASHYGDCVTRIGRLGSGAGRSFGYGEIYLPIEISPIRIDEFLAEQSRQIHAEITSPETCEANRYYKGQADSSFDGVLGLVDLRGNLPEGKLILSAGGKEIDCIFSGLPHAEIRALLDKEMRVRVRGRAYYDGRSGLPRRIIISNPPTIVATKRDFRKWKAAFSPFHVSEIDEFETEAA